MGTWDCIDGGLSEQWTYTSLGIMEDIRPLLVAMDTGWPANRVDDTVWSSALIVSRAPHLATRLESSVQAIVEEVRVALARRQLSRSSIELATEEIRIALQRVPLADSA